MFLIKAIKGLVRFKIFIDLFIHNFQRSLITMATIVTTAAEEEVVCSDCKQSDY